MDTKHYVVDQIEGEIAVLETPEQERLELPRGELPDDAGEGSMLVRREDETGNVSFTVDHDWIRALGQGAPGGGRACSQHPQGARRARAKTAKGVDG